MKKSLFLFFFLIYYISQNLLSAQNYLYKERATGAMSTLSFIENGISLNVMGRILNFKLENPNYGNDLILYQNPGEKNAIFLSKKNYSFCLYLDGASLLYIFDLSSSTPPPYYIDSNSDNTTNNFSTYKQACSMCKGKGWIAGCSTPNYGTGSYICHECDRTVPASHSHDKCPACNGKGYINKIK